jgi:hypothetical protein
MPVALGAGFLILLGEEAGGGLEHSGSFPDPILRRTRMSNCLPFLSRLFRRIPQDRRIERPAKFLPLLECLEGRALPGGLHPGLAHAAHPVIHAAHVRHTTPVVLVKSLDKSPDQSQDRSGVADGSADKSVDKSASTSQDKSADTSLDKSTDKSPDKSQDKSGVGDSSPDKSLDKNGETSTDKSTDTYGDKSVDSSTDKPADNSPSDSRP